MRQELGHCFKNWEAHLLGQPVLNYLFFVIMLACIWILYTIVLDPALYNIAKFRKPFSLWDCRALYSAKVHPSSRSTWYFSVLHWICAVQYTHSSHAVCFQGNFHFIANSFYETTNNHILAKCNSVGRHGYYVTASSLWFWSPLIIIPSPIT